MLVERDEARLLASRLREVLEVTRDVVGSQSVTYVATSSAAALAQVGRGASAQIWTGPDADRLRCAADSRRGGDRRLESSRPAPEAIRRAVVSGRTVVGGEDPTRVVFPLLVGARVIGAAELRGSTLVGPAHDPVLATLVDSVATALEAARLYTATDELARLDPLTRLPNRRCLDHDLTAELSLVRRAERPLSFLMLDLDHFKAVNDTCGHPTGDRVLQHVADLLRSAVRASDTVYRLGGEELAVIARETPSLGAGELADRLRRAIDRSEVLRDDVRGTVPITTSIGVATVSGRSRAASVAEVVAAADAALYRAKRAGRNRVEVSTEVPGDDRRAG